VRCYTPEHLADMFQLVFVRKGFLWYGCEAVPQWTSKGWDLNEAKACIILLQKEVLSMAGERDSLTLPRTCQNDVL
jgi:hypothetical protein